MPLPDFFLLLDYDRFHFFPSRRLELGIALAGCATANAFGAKIKPEDVIPKVPDPEKDAKQKELDNRLAMVSLKAAQIRRAGRVNRS